VFDVIGHFLCQPLLLLIGDVQLLVFLDDLQVLEIVGEVLVVTRRHELDGLAQGSINHIQCCADCLSEATGDILILKFFSMESMDADQSKDILNLDVVLNYDCNFGHSIPFFCILNVVEINLEIKFPHADLKSAQYSLFH
jgi:hypothetical protein